MQQMYGNVTKILVDSRQGSNLLYLPLDKIIQQAAAADAAEAASVAAPAAPATTGTPTPAPAADSRTRDSARPVTARPVEEIKK